MRSTMDLTLRKSYELFDFLLDEWDELQSHYKFEVEERLNSRSILLLLL
jgi:hypothetical protein